MELYKFKKIPKTKEKLYIKCKFDNCKYQLYCRYFKVDKCWLLQQAKRGTHDHVSNKELIIVDMNTERLESQKAEKAEKLKKEKEKEQEKEQEQQQRRAYQHKLPLLNIEMLDTKDIALDGLCGFRSIAHLMEPQLDNDDTKKGIILVKRKLRKTLITYEDKYRKLFPVNTFHSVKRRIEFDMKDNENNQSMHEEDWFSNLCLQVVADAYNVAFTLFDENNSRRSSTVVPIVNTKKMQVKDPYILVYMQKEKHLEPGTIKAIAPTCKYPALCDHYHKIGMKKKWLNNICQERFRLDVVDDGLKKGVKLLLAALKKTKKKMKLLLVAMRKKKKK
jgi:hypothetical protein